ncbi:MAG: prolipoprotein diacylglyceryl transferase [Ruminiclostridium sp.]|nr:prolipoprotein diacylglyceryl transferase [Ruminiclostridium sp.]
MNDIYDRRVEFPNLFSGEIDVNRVALDLFGFKIFWYAVIIAAGLILAVLYCTKRGKKVGLTSDDIFDVALFGGIAGFLGARIFYVIFWNINPENTYKYDLITTFTTIHDGGLAIYGGIICGSIVGVLTTKIRKAPVLPLCDMGGCGFLIGQAIGRWGNFINQEAYGAPTAGDLPWGMTGNIIENDPVVIAAQNALPAGQYALVHPCFLYESLWCALGLAFIHFVVSRLQTFDGEQFLWYVIWYGTGRGFIEGLRTDSLYVGGTGIRVSQLIGFATAVFCLILLVYFKLKVKKMPEYRRWKDTEACTERMEKYYTDQKNEEETEKALKAFRRAEKEQVSAPSIFDENDK